MTSLGFEAKNQTIFQMIADLDEDGSGALEFAEFFELMTHKVGISNNRESVHKLFNLFDDGKTGSISIDNLRRVAQELAENIDETELEEMISRADGDGDRLVSEEEFYCIVTKKSFK